MAHEGSHGIVAERMTTMKNMAREMTAIGEMLVGKAPFDPAALYRHADILHKNCHHVESMFPAGSTEHHSRAMPAVWEKPEAFHREMQLLHEATERLTAIAARGDKEELIISFGEVDAACRSCHEAFRLPGD